MKHKKYRLRFVRNVIVCVIALFIVARILDVMPGFKRDQTKGITNLVIGDEDITENLKNNIFVDANKVVYLSYEDVKELFDSKIFFDEVNNQIITTSDTKVANLGMNQKYININGTVLDILGSLIKYEDKMYLPISDMELVYNIEVNYIKETDVVTIDKLSKQLIRATISNDTKVKSKMRGFSQNLAKLEQGEQISYFEEIYKGWIKVRTNSGIVGYIKSSLITNQCVIRQEMEDKEKARNIKAEETRNWIKIDENIIEEKNLQEYYSRASIIDNVIIMVLSEGKKEVVIYEGSESEYFTRFIIELVPRLREIGVIVGIRPNENSQKEEIKNIVDYIVVE